MQQSDLPTSPAGEEARSLLNWRKLTMQAIGFVVGMVLLVLVIRKAMEKGDWTPVRQANPLLVAGLFGCSLAGLMANATIFWLVIWPVKRLRLIDMQLLNLSVAVLNYAPIRLGLIARVAYHLRVDRMSLVLLGGWFAAVAATMGLCFGAVAVATFLRPQFDLLWAAAIAGQLLLGGFLIWGFCSRPWVVRLGKGMDRMLRHPAAMWGSIALRMVDIGAVVGRMACAAAILKLELSASDILLLAIAAYAVSLNPIGRAGFREWAVTVVAASLVSVQLSGEELKAQMAQLALVESAGEALASIPLGALALLWFRRKWTAATKQSHRTDDTA